VLKGVPVSFLPEIIVGGIVLITLGSLWLANAITKREHEAEVEETKELTCEHWQKVNDDAVAWMHKIKDGQSAAFRAARDQFDVSVKELLRLTKEGK